MFSLVICYIMHRIRLLNYDFIVLFTIFTERCFLYRICAFVSIYLIFLGNTVLLNTVDILYKQ